MWFSRWNSYVAEASYLRTIIIAALVTTALEWTGLAHDKGAGCPILEIMGHQENCNNEVE